MGRSEHRYLKTGPGDGAAERPRDVGDPISRNEITLKERAAAKRAALGPSDAGANGRHGEIDTAPPEQPTTPVPSVADSQSPGSDSQRSHAAPISENKGEPWGEDFSYDYYWRMVDELLKQDSGYSLHTFSEAPQEINGPDSRTCLVRHDIDSDPKIAAKMAAKELHRDIRSTYFVITNSDRYKITDSANLKALEEIARCGHEVGLHYNPNQELRSRPTEIHELTDDIRDQASYLENIIQTPVSSFSFHEPGGHPS